MDSSSCTQKHAHVVCSKYTVHISGKPSFKTDTCITLSLWSCDTIKTTVLICQWKSHTAVIQYCIQCSISSGKTGTILWISFHMYCNYECLLTVYLSLYTLEMLWSCSAFWQCDSAYCLRYVVFDCFSVPMFNIPYFTNSISTKLVVVLCPSVSLY